MKAPTSSISTCGSEAQGDVRVTRMYYGAACRGLQQTIRKVEVIEDDNSKPHKPVSLEVALFFLEKSQSFEYAKGVPRCQRRKTTSKHYPICFVIPKNVTSERPIALFSTLSQWWVVGSSSGAREENNGGAQRTPWEAFLAVTLRQSQVAKLEHGVFRRARFEKKSLAEMEAGAQHSSRCHPASHRRENKRTRKPEKLEEGKVAGGRGWKTEGRKVRVTMKKFTRHGAEFHDRSCLGQRGMWHFMDQRNGEASDGETDQTAWCKNVKSARVRT